MTDDHPSLAPEQIYAYLSNVMYARRTKINPLWNAMLVAGHDKGKRWARPRCSSHESLPSVLTRPRLRCLPPHPPARSFLGYVDLLGTTYTSPTLATGFGAAVAQPLLREAVEARVAEAAARGETSASATLLSRAEAEALLDECMKVLFYRDARSLNKVRGGKEGPGARVRRAWADGADAGSCLRQYQIATVTQDGVDISASRSAETYWKFAEGLRGYGGQKQ